MDETTPRFSPAQARAVLRDRFGIEGELTPLPSERDQNFCIETRSGSQFVLKIAQAHEARAVLDLQNAMIAHLLGDIPDLELPRLHHALDGAAISEVQADAKSHFVRLFSWVEGVPLARAVPHGRRVLETLGRTLARIDLSLRTFSHPAMHRILHWDLRHADLAFHHADLLTAAERALIEDHVRAWGRIRWPELRHGAIHGDANDYNVLVRDGEVVSILDFGDTVHSALVCDLAIGLAYAMLGKPDPLSAAHAMVAAYHRVLPLTVAESEALFPLLATRLCMSVCLAAKNARDKGGDLYQQVSAAPAWELLSHLASHAPTRARAALVQACR
jgi:Ser/Thr protein kinase RdoA (MazF antagonist)